MRYALFYQPVTVGDILLIYFHPELKPTRHIQGKKIVKIYRGETLIGINIFQFSTIVKNMPTGFIVKPSKELLQAINHVLVKEGLEALPFAQPSGFVVGQINQKTSHPDSDQLFVCQVNLGKEKVTIVTNSTKVKENDYVVVATQNTVLFDGTIIMASPLKGVMSQGMFCSEKTLNIKPVTQEGVLVLPKARPLGEDFFGGN